MPPSHTVNLRLKSGALLASHSPPLSLVKITMVLAARPTLLERTEDLSDAAVDALEHSHVVGARARARFAGHHVAAVAGRDRRLVGHLVRPMRRVERDVDEERTSRVLPMNFTARSVIRSVM